MGKNYEAVVHSLLARHYHRVGDLTNERAHRLDAISALWQDASGNESTDNAHVGDERSVPEEYRALIATSHIALAVSCLRAPGAEALLAASAAASTAERFAFTENQRLASSLLTALSSGRGSPRQKLMLSALTAMDVDPTTAAVDVPGFARYFLATLGGEGKAADKSATDNAHALVVRWDQRGGFDFIEALCAAADVICQQEGKSNWEQANDLLERAVKEAGRIGNDLDKGEPLLGMAKLYVRRGRIVEAEGMFRSVEERFEPLRSRMAFTVSSADLYCRNMEAFADFLSRVEFNGRLREREGDVKREKMAPVRDMYASILNGTEERNAPLWFVDSVLPHFEIPAPLVPGVN